MTFNDFPGLPRERKLDGNADVMFLNTGYSYQTFPVRHVSMIVINTLITRMDASDSTIKDDVQIKSTHMFTRYWSVKQQTARREVERLSEG